VTKAIPRSQELYKVKDFAKWAKKVGISDRVLLDTVLEMNRGLLGDRLGAHVYKKRLGIDGRGKRGGGRVVLLYRTDDVALFLHGYLKNENDEISENEVRQLRLFAQQFLVLSPTERSRLRGEGKLILLEG
jgi:hypothetical protein